MDDEYELPRVMWVPDSVENQEDFLRKTRKGNVCVWAQYLLKLTYDLMAAQTHFFKLFRVPKQQNHPASCGIHRSKRLDVVIQQHLEQRVPTFSQQRIIRLHQGDVQHVVYVPCRLHIPRRDLR